MNTTRGSQVKPVQPLMHDWVSFNHNIIRGNDAQFPAVSNGGLYGKGVFTTMAIRNGLPFLFDKHWKRLENNSEQLAIRSRGLRKETLFSSIIALIDRNAVGNGRCRVTVFDCSQSEIWDSGGGSESAVMIQTGDPRGLKSDLLLDVSKISVQKGSPLNNIKSCNYMDRILAFEAARGSGFDEAVRINGNSEIVSACMANIFWIKDDRIFTPAVETGCLEGTTRAFVMDRCAVAAVEAGLDALKTAESVFLTSAGLGIAGVSSINHGSERYEFNPPGEEFFSKNNLQQL